MGPLEDAHRLGMKAQPAVGGAEGAPRVDLRLRLSAEPHLQLRRRRIQPVGDAHVAPAHWVFRVRGGKDVVEDLVRRRRRWGSVRGRSPMK
jgi:hypothetical protein